MSVHQWYFGGVKRLAVSTDRFEKYDIFVEPGDDDVPFVEKKHNKHKVLPLIPKGSPNRIVYGQDGYHRLCIGNEINEGFIKKIALDQKYSEWQVLSPLQNTDEFVVTGVAYTYPIKLDPTLVDYPIYLFPRPPRSKLMLLKDDERRKYRLQVKNDVLEIFRSFTNVLYIELLCSPVEKNGASDALFNYIETFYSHTYDAIFLKSIDEPRTLECYRRNGFIDVCELGGRDEDFHFMYKPLRVRHLTISERKSYDL